MSRSFHRRTASSAQSYRVQAPHRLPAQTERPAPQASSSPPSAERIMRMQQLDASVMQTLNRQAQPSTGSASPVRGQDEPTPKSIQAAQQQPPTVIATPKHSTVIQPQLAWDRSTLEARAGKKTGRSEEYKSIVRIVDTYSGLTNPLAAPRGLQEMITACEHWLRKNQNSTSAKVQNRIIAIKELKAAAQKELGSLTRSQTAVNQPPAATVNQNTVDALNGSVSNDYDKLPSDDYDKLPSDDYDKLPSDDYDKLPSDDYDKLPSDDYDKLPVAPGDVSGEYTPSEWMTSAIEKLPKESAPAISSNLKANEPTFEDFNEKTSSPKASADLRNADSTTPEKSAKSLTQEDYDRILSAIPKTDEDLKAISQGSRYKSLSRVGGGTKYEDSEYRDEFVTSKKFILKKLEVWEDTHFIKPVEHLDGVLALYDSQSEEVQEARAKAEKLKKDLIDRYDLQGIKYDEKTGKADRAQFDTYKVDYLDKEERQSYQLGLGGQITQNGEVFDTQGNFTFFGGKGWAIYVMDPGGTFYSASHKMGRFHHSSFLSGGAIAGAGEWIVENGQLKKINSKTGHYHASGDALLQVLRELEANGVGLQGVQLTLRGEGKPEDAHAWKQLHERFHTPQKNMSTGSNKTSNKAEDHHIPLPSRVSDTETEDTYNTEKGDAQNPETEDAYNTETEDTYNTEKGDAQNPETEDAYNTESKANGNQLPTESSDASSIPADQQPASTEPDEDSDSYVDVKIEQSNSISGGSPDSSSNLVMGRTGGVVSRELVQAIRQDILATGWDSKWADEPEIKALAEAMGIHIQLQGYRGGPYGSGRRHLLKYNGKDHYDAMLLSGVDSVTGQEQFTPVKIPGDGDCFYSAIARIQSSYGLAAPSVPEMRGLVNQALSDADIADIAAMLRNDDPRQAGLGANFQQLMRSGAANHFLDVE